MVPAMAPRSLPLAILAVQAALVPGVARGDGAFPDEQSIFFFDAAPQRIAVGTNFGLIL